MQTKHLTLLLVAVMATTTSLATTRNQCTGGGGTPTLDTNSGRPGFTGTYCSGGSASVRDTVISDLKPHKPGTKLPPKQNKKIDS
ncbi:MAG: hypothetical protein EPO09_19030 [Aquabacterium sp.]|uniref:hypothetical protein n=1 Tax=Aquabacterium sp. TaxID=1872578 RepID=UPI001216C22F|nr:hypothetical protein [Aquabacterium sp.]TAK87087.1 MAG: hypothetical protein EPO09_19030 [Aquabacterium sp.]